MDPTAIQSRDPIGALKMAEVSDPLNDIAYYVSQLDPNGGIAIYVFHGVVKDGLHYDVRNYNWKHLPERYFSELIASLKAAGGVPLSMDDVIQHHFCAEPYPPKAFAVTFDDGFENNASIAASILRDANVPMTLYLTTRWVSDNAMGWADKLDHCMERVKSGSLSLPSIGTFTFSTPRERKEVLVALRKAIKSSGELFNRLDEITSSMYRQLGVSEDDGGDRWLDQKLSWDQVRTLFHSGVTIGGHSVNHETLSQLSDSGLGNVLDLSLETLKVEAGITTRHYAYPEGHERSFDDRVIRALLKRGIVCCPTAMGGTNTHEVSPFKLRRIAVMS